MVTGRDPSRQVDLPAPDAVRSYGDGAFRPRDQSSSKKPSASSFDCSRAAFSGVSMNWDSFGLGPNTSVTRIWMFVPLCRTSVTTVGTRAECVRIRSSLERSCAIDIL